MSRAALLDLSLAFDAAPLAAREQMGAWLVEAGGQYGRGLADSLLRPEPRRYVLPSPQPVRA